MDNCFASLADISKLMENKKSFDKWIYKFQSRSDFSVRKIIECGY